MQIIALSALNEFWGLVVSWSIGYDKKWKRDIGYGVPAICDHPDCDKQITRGLAYVCGSEPYGGEHGCGLYFCQEHLNSVEVDRELVRLCSCCESGGESEYKPKPDVKEWVEWKLTDESWKQWRAENPDEVKAMMEFLNK